MSKFLVTTINLICAVQFCAAQINANANQEESLAKKFILSTEYKQLLTYSPNVKYFLTSAYGNLEYGPNGLITYIHEALHLLDNIKSTGMGNVLYYWYDSTTLLKAKLLEGYVTTDSIFNKLPFFLKDKSITKTYIACTNNCFSRAYGVYGLLEEFNAMSSHTKSLCTMYDFFDTCNYTKTIKFWRGYLKCKYDSWMNFYYFNVFFSTYIKYIESNRKDFYSKLTNDADFKNSFTKIYNKYREALKCLNSNEKKVLDKIDLGKDKKNIYSFFKEYNIVKELSESEDTQKYISVLLNKQ